MISPNPQAAFPLRRKATICIIALFFWGASLPLFAREVVDMAGNRVMLPERIDKVVGVSPPCTYLLYAIDPTLIAGLNFPPSQEELQFLSPSFSRLPVIGGFFGQGRTINLEVLLGVKPDLLLYWDWNNKASAGKYAKIMARLDMTRLAVRLDSITDYPEAIRFLSETLNRRERGLQLYTYAVSALETAATVTASIPPGDRIPVYYAEGADGLSTERAKSMHSELIPLAGGKNVHESQATTDFGMEKISMEKVLFYDPVVILVKEPIFFRSIYDDARWQNIRAVRDHRVYLIPQLLFNWFDRPPSFMRLLGIKWLLNILHPERYQLDMVAETISFYRLFLNIELTETQAKALLQL